VAFLWGDVSPHRRRADIIEILAFGLFSGWAGAAIGQIEKKKNSIKLTVFLPKYFPGRGQRIHK
jgi:hypothetical protein